MRRKVANKLKLKNGQIEYFGSDSPNGQIHCCKQEQVVQTMQHYRRRKHNFEGMSQSMQNLLHDAMGLFAHWLGDDA